MHAARSNPAREGRRQTHFGDAASRGRSVLYDNARMLTRLSMRIARFVLLAAAPSLAVAAAASAPSMDAEVPIASFQQLLTAPGMTQLDDALMLYPAVAWYPADEARAGAQGTAIVVMDLGPDGKVAKTTLVSSTHSRVLDEQALRLASQLHWMGERKAPPRASLRVIFVRDTADSVQQKTCAELNLDVAWQKSHDPMQPSENVGALRTIRGLVNFNSSWMPDRADREAGRPAREALFVASRRAVDECAAHPELRLADVFRRQMRAAAAAHEHEPALPVPAIATGPLPRSILFTSRDAATYAGSMRVLAKDPDYPAAALAANLQGEVEVQAELGEHGAIEQVHLHRDYSGSPLLVDAASEILRRHLLAEAHLETRDPATLPAALLATVKFERDDETSVLSLDCQTFLKDEAAWHGARLRLPDVLALRSALSSRAWHLTTGRLPQRERWMSDADAAHELQMRAMDADCGAAPAKLAIDALIDAIDAW